MFSLKIITAFVFITTGKSQLLPPPVDLFLSQLFGVALPDVENLTKTFDFQPISDTNINYILHDSNKTTRIDLKNNGINLNNPTKFLIHGWQDSGQDPYHQNISERYHNQGNYNIITVDWGALATKDYIQASSSTQNLGNVIGDFIINLFDNKSFDNVHLIGHSLGGHVAGFVGQRVFEKTGKKLGRITGLDVAAPMFEIPIKRSAGFRLSQDDAHFVDIIHTNVGLLGVAEPIGTADFYVDNGGPFQSECIGPDLFESIGCSHFKAFEYFMESVDGRKFEALSCPDSIQYHLLACDGNRRIVMGENVPKDAKGSYYVEAQEPLAYRNAWRNPIRLRLPYF